jgi:hypothetical protein
VSRSDAPTAAAVALPGAPSSGRAGGPATARGSAGARRTRVLVGAAVLVAIVAAASLALGVLGGGSSPARRAALSPADASAARAIVARARTMVSAAPEALGYRLVVAGPVAGLRGQTDTDARTITLFVAPDDAPSAVAHDLGHELGHAVDATRVDDAERAAYLRARGMPRASWFPGHGASDLGSGAGDFAEVFALCHSVSPVFRSRLAARPADPCGVLPTAARTAKLGDGGS